MTDDQAFTDGRHAMLVLQRLLKVANCLRTLAHDDRGNLEVVTFPDVVAEIYHCACALRRLSLATFEDDPS